MKVSDEAADLRYLQATSVQCPQGTLSDFQVCTDDAHSLGSVEGVLISPSSRRLAYFVTKCPGSVLRRHYLVPLEPGAVMQHDPKTLRLAARRDELKLGTFSLRSVPSFSDEDVVTVMFANTA